MCFVHQKAGRACALSTKAGFGAQPRLLSKLRNSFCASHGQYYTIVLIDFRRQTPSAYILYTKDVMIKNDIRHLPLYMAMFL